MTRTITMLAIGVAAAVSFGLYQLSYEVRKLEGRIGDLNRQIVQERENIEVLGAEWAYLNRPDVLQARVERYLPDSAPIKARQIVAASALPLVSQRPVVAIKVTTESAPKPSSGPSRKVKP